MGLLTCLLTCIQATKEEREFNEQLRKNGLEMAINQCSTKINETIPSQDIAVKFILQELDFSQKEDIFPQKFMLTSGFHKLEYEGTLEMFHKSKPQLLPIQAIFDDFLRKIKNEKEMVAIAIDILETVMYKWKVGKYSIEEPTNQEEIIKKEEEPPIEENIIIKEPKIEKPRVLHYSKERVNELMEEYSDIIGDIIIGEINPKDKLRIEAFKEHISRAGIEGKSPHALVLSCFYTHREPYSFQLPIAITQMDDESLKFFMSILKGFSKQGFSEPFLDYMDKYREEFNLLTQRRR